MSKIIVAVVAVCALFLQVRADVVLQPHPLPCAYEVHFTSDLKINGTNITFLKADGDYYIHGNYIKMYQSAFMEHEYRYDHLFRPDLGSGENTTMHYYALMNGTYENECWNSVISLDKMDDIIDEAIGKVRHNTTHQKTDKRVLDGKEYLVYVDENAPNITWIFVDDDNYIIAEESEVEIAVQGQTFKLKGLGRYSYVMYTPITKFIMDNTTSEKCADVAYSPPVQKVCPDPTPSSSSHSGSQSSAHSGSQSSAHSSTHSSSHKHSSMASTTKAAAVALVGVALIALL